MASEAETAAQTARQFIEVEARHMVPLLFRGTQMHITFKQGSWWTADSDKNVTYDPSSFSREGMNFSPVQQLFALCHELYAHLAEDEKLRATERGEELYQNYFTAATTNTAVAKLENHMQDTRGNRGLLQLFPIFRKADAVTALYDEKLFKDPGKDLRQEPKHLQFGHAILLDYMLAPKDKKKVKVDKGVAKIVADLRAGVLPSGEAARHPVTGAVLGDVIELITNETLTDAEESMLLRQAILWPIVNALYEEDVREGGLEHARNPFADAYEQDERTHVGGPQTAEERAEIDQATRSAYSKPGSGGGSGAGDGKRSERGLTPFDAAWRATEQHVRSLAEMLVDTVEDPLQIWERDFITRGGQIEGDFLDDMAEVYMHLRRRGGGEQDIPAWEDDHVIERSREEIDQHFAPLDFYMVVDTTGSMSGGPLAQAATAALLLTRAAVERKRVAEEAGLDEPATQIAVHTFDTTSQIALPLVDATTLDRARLEQMFAAINQTGGGNDEPRIFARLAQDLVEHQPTPEEPRKRIVFIITDGGASGIEQARAQLDAIRSMPDVRVIPIGINVSRSYFDLYGNTAPVCKTLADVVRIVAQVLKEEMQTAVVTDVHEGRQK